MTTPPIRMALLSAAAVLALAPGAQAAPQLAVLARIPGPDGGWDFTTFDPAHRRVYVSRSDGILALDVDSGQVTPKLVDAQRTHVALPVNNGDDLVVTSTTVGGVVIADAKTGAVKATLKTGAKPDGAWLEPATGLAWVLDNAGGGITIIDPKAGAKAGAIAVGGALESPATDGKGRVFITVEDKAEIVVIDAKARKLVAEWKLAGCEEPNGLAYGEGRLVVACSNKVAKVVSAADGKEIASLAIGPRSDTALYDPARKVVYVPTGGDAKLTMISPAQAKVVGTAATQTGARSQALDPKTGDLYLPAASFAPPAQPGGRPAMVPGSFVILKVGTR